MTKMAKFGPISLFTWFYVLAPCFTIEMATKSWIPHLFADQKQQINKRNH